MRGFDRPGSCGRCGGAMEFRLLGTLEVRAGDGLLPLGRPKQRALLALLLLAREPRGGARAADRRAVGRGAARDGGQGGAGVRLAAAQAAAGRDAGDAAAGLPARGRAGGGRPAAVRAAGRRGAEMPSPARASSLLRRGARLCGAGRRWPSSARSRSRGSRRGGSRTCGWRRSRSGSRPTSRSAATRSSSASSRR